MRGQFFIEEVAGSEDRLVLKRDIPEKDDKLTKYSGCWTIERGKVLLRVYRKRNNEEFFKAVKRAIDEDMVFIESSWTVDGKPSLNKVPDSWEFSCRISSGKIIKIKKNPETW